jgi:hypothetical protein
MSLQRKMRHMIVSAHFHFSFSSFTLNEGLKSLWRKQHGRKIVLYDFNGLSIVWNSVFKSEFIFWKILSAQFFFNLQTFIIVWKWLLVSYQSAFVDVWSTPKVWLFCNRLTNGKIYRRSCACSQHDVFPQAYHNYDYYYSKFVWNRIAFTWKMCHVIFLFFFTHHFCENFTFVWNA